MRKFAFCSPASFLSLVVLLATTLTLGCTSGSSTTSDNKQQAASAPSSESPTGDVASTNTVPAQEEVASTNDETVEAAVATSSADSAPAPSEAGPEDAAAEPEAAETAETTATADADVQPASHEAAKPVVESYADGVPPVLLSAGHAALCKVMVGDAFPAIELPTLDGGSAQQLSSLAGRRATVVVFWSGDRWMSESALRDLAAIELNEGVAVVGIATKIAQDAAGNLLAKTGAKFPQLFDADGQALAAVGQDALPRVYVLDGEGRIAWFDLEYSEATRRELAQTLAALSR
jgi:hypothetical protein